MPKFVNINTNIGKMMDIPIQYHLCHISIAIPAIDKIHTRLSVDAYKKKFESASITVPSLSSLSLFLLK